MEASSLSSSVSGISVLVVDDQDCIVDLLTDIVEQLGFKTVRAYDGQDALERFNSGDVQLVITDIKMPRMDGIELMKQIKQIRADVPVIAITGFGAADSEGELLDEGMDAYLEKPFHVARIEDTICSVLRKFQVLG